MTKRKNSVGSEIYSGTASFGRIMAIFSAVMATLAGLIMIPLGIYLIARKSKLTATTNATIICDDCCIPTAEDSNITYNCTLAVEYSVDGTQYNEPITTSGQQNYNNVKSATVYYDPKKPSDVSLDTDNTHTVGIIVLVVGIIIPALAWLWLYFATKYKSVAAVGGVAAGLDLLSGGNIGAIF